MLAKTIHIDHDTLYAQLHFKLCNKTGVKLDNEHWYDYVETNGEAKVNVLLNQQVQTCRTIPNNKPAILVRDNEKGTCMLIDVAVFGDRNVIKIEAETILKYRVPYNRKSVHVECERKSDTGNSRCNRNHLTVTQTIPEQYVEIARN